MLRKLRYLSLFFDLYLCTAAKLLHVHSLTAKLHPGSSANLYWCNARKDGAVS